MNNFVISLTTATQRRQHIKRQFDEHQIDFTFFNAVTPNEVKKIANDFNLCIDNSDLTDGELGCFFSHLLLWQQCIDNNMDYITVFEDDVHLGENSHLFLNNYDWINKKFELIKIEAFETSAKMARIRHPTLDNREIRPLVLPHLGTCGYIISMQMAKKIMMNIQSIFSSVAINLPIDHILFDKFLEEFTAFQLLPAISIQNDRIEYVTNKKTNIILESQLNQSRDIRLIKAHQERKKISFPKKIVREVSRPFKKIYNRNYKNDISFR